MDLAELNTKIIAHHTSCQQNKYNISDCIFFLPDLKKCKSIENNFFFYFINDIKYPNIK